MDPEFGLLDGLIIWPFLIGFFVLAVFTFRIINESPLGDMIRKVFRKIMGPVGDWYYSKSWKTQSIVSHTVQTIWYIVVALILIWSVS